ncbi:MAG TPA: GH92 family glycosyl hydrolase [Sunxiuqinia sp.]|nr:GH92 family glycosyl hydrolase [Sunxiuqinia sp.]
MSDKRLTYKSTLRLFFLLALEFQFQCSVGQKAGVAGYVDPFICTANDHGQTDVAAGVPFGMAKPCPDTKPKLQGTLAHSGYDYSSNEIKGFSQTRISGVGCTGAGGNLRLLPFLSEGNQQIPSFQKYLKIAEQAVPGYYSVIFDSQIRAEMTATREVAFYRFTFPKSGHAAISLDLASSFTGDASQQHHWLGDGLLSGKISASTVCGMGRYTFYFALAINKPGLNTLQNKSQLIFRFSTQNHEAVPVWCALSVVSESNAVQTLEDAMTKSFDQVKNDALKAWNDRLNAVKVETTNDTLKRIFYTHLYHALQSPFIINDDDGTYRGSDGKLYHSDQPQFFGWSIWDTFRTKLPLLSLIYPETYSQMMLSLRHLYQGGKPKWATQTEPFITVRTEHAIVALLEAQRKGLLPFSMEEIYPFLKDEMADLPFDSPDRVLESSYDLWVMSEIAGELDHPNDQKYFHKKAFQYRKTWRKYFKRMRRRADVMQARGLYEGTLWQYRWFVPFDIEGVQKMVGGKAHYEKQLDYFFGHELFNIGNQPDIQVPYLYAYTDSVWKTQRLVHRLLTEPTNNWYGTHEKLKVPVRRTIFTNTPDGYLPEMDDDAGTMSSWYVWSAMGLYPVFPGDTKLVISTPLFQKTIIQMGENQLVIEAKGLSDKNSYIQKASFNGTDLHTCFIDFNTIKNGGVLKLVMGLEPNKSWGTTRADRFYSLSDK